MSPFGSGSTISWQTVEIRTSDGVVLRAWLFTPNHSKGNCILALHGIADSRTGMLGLARMFVENGYTVLTPDSRGHGESGGDLVTYGLRESDDVHRWVEWLEVNQHPRNVFGMGESLGGAILLQSLAVEPRFNAVAAECSFATFERIAEDRVAQRIPAREPLAHLLALPMVWSGFLYARWKYGLDFRDVSPEASLRKTSTPVLLIHGLDDRNTDPIHSQILAAANPRSVTLWLVPGAKHIGAFATAPAEFQRRVLGWFAEHSAR